MLRRNKERPSFRRVHGRLISEQIWEQTLRNCLKRVATMCDRWNTRMLLNCAFGTPREPVRSSLPRMRGGGTPRRQVPIVAPSPCTGCVWAAGAGLRASTGWSGNDWSCSPSIAPYFVPDDDVRFPAMWAPSRSAISTHNPTVGESFPPQRSRLCQRKGRPSENLVAHCQKLRCLQLRRTRRT